MGPPDQHLTCGLYWDGSRGLMVDGVSRAPARVIKHWCQNEPTQDEIRKHETNVPGVAPDIWWSAQLKLYGIDYSGSRPYKQAVKILRRRIVNLDTNDPFIPVSRRVQRYANDLKAKAIKLHQQQPPPAPTSQSRDTHRQRAVTSNSHLKRRADQDIGSPPKRHANGSSVDRGTSLTANINEAGTIGRHVVRRRRPFVPQAETSHKSSGSSPSISSTESEQPEASSWSLANEADVFCTSPLPDEWKSIDWALVFELGSKGQPVDAYTRERYHLPDSGYTFKMPTVCEDRVRFIPYDDHLYEWITEYEHSGIKFSCKYEYEDRYIFFIDDCRYQPHVPAARNALIRASRWLDTDVPLAFYNAQLMFRNLPPTRSKEVSKWRLYAFNKDEIEHPVPAPAMLRIFVHLRSIFKMNHFQLCRGGMNNDPRVGFANIHELPMALESAIQERRLAANRKDAQYCLNIGDLTEQILELPGAKFRNKPSYDLVLEKWLSVRSQLRKPTYPAVNEKRAVSNKCNKCGKKLRNCKYPYCETCGETVQECKCDICESRGRDDKYGRLGDFIPCPCLEYDKCQLRFYADGRAESHRSFYHCRDYNKLLSIHKSDGESRCNCNPSPGTCFQGCRLSRLGQEHLENGRERSVRESEYLRKMLRWVETKEPEYYTRNRRPRKAGAQALTMSDISGTYELVTRDVQVNKCSELSELVVACWGSSLYGRYRIGLDIHGLFRTNRLPKTSSTEVVQCHVAIEDYNKKDGSWLFTRHDSCPGRTGSIPTAPATVIRSDSLDDTDGIVFLGNGLIKLSPSFFTQRKGKIDGDVVFGVKTSDYHDSGFALKASLLAIHREMCACKGGEHIWRNEEAELAPRWDEFEIDRLVDRLGAHRHWPNVQ